MHYFDVCSDLKTTGSGNHNGLCITAPHALFNLVSFVVSGGNSKDTDPYSPICFCSLSLYLLL